MMPQGAPTTWFSTAWQAAARSVAVIELPQPAATAAPAATSSAADEATPLPSGTVESMSSRRPAGSDCPSRAARERKYSTIPTT